MLGVTIDSVTAVTLCDPVSIFVHVPFQIFSPFTCGGDIMRGRRLLPLKLYVLTLHCQRANCSKLHNLDLKPTWGDYISQGSILIHQTQHTELCGLITWPVL